MDYCYENNAVKAKQIIHMKSEIFQTTCFEFVKNDFEISRHYVENKVDNDEYLKKFISHKCFQEEVRRKWIGDSKDLSTTKYVLYLIVCFLLSPFLYIPFVIFNVSIIIFS